MPVRTPSRLPFWDVLTEAQVGKLHADTLTVLEQTGVEVNEGRSRQLLAKAGAAIEGARVRIPAPLVEQALLTAPKEILIYDREKQPAMRLAPGYSYFGTGSDTTWVVDPEVGERRRTDLDSIRMTARLGDALPNLDFIMSMGTAPEIAPELADQHHFAAMVESTTKPVMFTVQSERAARRIVAMCAVICGGPEALWERPFAVLYAMPTAPLYHTAEALSALLVCAEAGIPAVYSSAPQFGATGPITIAGSLVVANHGPTGTRPVVTWTVMQSDLTFFSLLPRATPGRRPGRGGPHHGTYVSSTRNVGVGLGGGVLACRRPVLGEGLG